LVTVAAACSGDVAIGDFDARYTEAVCKARVRCNLSMDAGSCGQLVGGPVPAATIELVYAGAIDYDPHRAGQCVSRIENMPCDEQDPAFRMRLVGIGALPVPYAASDPCDAIFSGATQTHGGLCASPVECAGPPRFAFPFDQRCPNGTCASSLGADASCFIDEDCLTGLYCAGSAGAMTCAPQQPLGAPCDAATAGCVFPNICSTTLCDATTAFTAATGAPCSASVGCADVRDACGPNGTCKRLALPGEPCGPCVSWALCTNGTCVACPNGSCATGGGW
jgi:hypothetical protein